VLAASALDSSGPEFIAMQIAGNHDFAAVVCWLWEMSESKQRGKVAGIFIATDFLSENKAVL
jgi:hypothetical protein